MGGNMTMCCYVEKVWVKAENENVATIRRPDKLMISIMGQVALPGYFLRGVDTESGIEFKTSMESWLRDSPVCPKSNSKYMAYEIQKILRRARCNPFAFFWSLASRFGSRYLGWRCFADNGVSRPWLLFAWDQLSCPCGNCTISVTAWAGGKDRKDGHLLIQRVLDAGAHLNLYPWDLDPQQVPTRS